MLATMLSKVDTINYLHTEDVGHCREGAAAGRDGPAFPDVLLAQSEVQKFLNIQRDVVDSLTLYHNSILQKNNS